MRRPTATDGRAAAGTMGTPYPSPVLRAVDLDPAGPRPRPRPGLVRSAGVTPTGDHPTGVHPTGDHSTGGHSIGDHSTGDHSTGGHSIGDPPLGDRPRRIRPVCSPRPRRWPPAAPAADREAGCPRPAARSRNRYRPRRRQRAVRRRGASASSYQVEKERNGCSETRPTRPAGEPRPEVEGGPGPGSENCPSIDALGEERTVPPPSLDGFERKRYVPRLPSSHRPARERARNPIGACYTRPRQPFLPVEIRLDFSPSIVAAWPAGSCLDTSRSPPHSKRRGGATPEPSTPEPSTRCLARSGKETR